jgi:Ca-activated chloride channel family protein
LKELNRAAPQDSDAPPRRRAIVVLSDGEDNVQPRRLRRGHRSGGTRGHGGVRHRGWACAPCRPARSARDAQFVLRRLAEQTGGRAFFPHEARDLEGVYSEIKAELASQYSLAYESNNPRRDGQFRRISVRIDRNDAVTRTRPGYYASIVRPRAGSDLLTAGTLLLLVVLFIALCCWV